MAETFVFENRYAAPPAYAAAWLTDFRRDDGPMFGLDPADNVERRGPQVITEARNPMGRVVTRITLATPTRWTAESETTKHGKVVMRSRLVETVRADGAGSLHRAEITMDPQTALMRALWPLFRVMMRKAMRQGFASMRERMDAAYRAGQPPDA